MSARASAAMHVGGPRRRAGGASLVEVLVSVFMLSVGLLGLAGLQLTGMKSGYGAHQRSQATLLAYDLIDRLRANRDVALGGGYDRADYPDAAAVCDPDMEAAGTVAARDLAEWFNALACQLPSGTGRIVRDGTVFTVSVRWDDSRAGMARGGAAAEAFAFRTEL